MRIAIVSESPSDEAAVKVLVDATLGIETDLVWSPRLRPEGWPSVLNLLPIIIKYLHYNTDAEGMALVVDSDESPLHYEAHEGIGCRLCELRNTAERELIRVRPIPGKRGIKIAIGLAVPAIEAWYQCGLDPHVNEPTWQRKLLGEQITYDRQSLKNAAYGHDRLPSFVRTEMATKAAKRLTTSTELLLQLFPGGFGAFIRDLRAW